MTHSFKILPHPADVKLQITASTKEELFQGALAGMASIIDAELSKKAPIVKENIEVHSLDLDMLLVDFLNEILTKSDIYNCVFDKIKIEKLTSDSLRGTIEGRKMKEFSEEIKAVTYHGLEIKQDKSGNCEVTILFDI